MAANVWQTKNISNLFSEVQKSWISICAERLFKFAYKIGSLTDYPVHRTKQNGQEDEPRVPVVALVHGRDAQEHEDDRFRGTAQHFHRVFDRRVRLVGNVGFHVVFHGDTAEGYPATTKNLM